MLTSTYIMLFFVLSLVYTSTTATTSVPTHHQLQSLTTPLAEQFKQTGYVELCDNHHGATTFDTLYAYFDKLIIFLQSNPAWAQKLYIAKERFIRSPDKNYYATDFFGFYDESKKDERGQLAFYYAPHFHTFLCSHYPECTQVEPLMQFFDACRDMQISYGTIFNDAAQALGLPTLFSSSYGQPPILFKVVKYLPAYSTTMPHYDGTAFSLFLDSTDTTSLLIAPYKTPCTVNDFSVPVRTFFRTSNPRSILLIPGILLTDYAIYPTPHIVIPRGTTRYATIAFAMRPHHTPLKNECYPLPRFQH